MMGYVHRVLMEFEVSSDEEDFEQIAPEHIYKAAAAKLLMAEDADSLSCFECHDTDEV